MGRCPKAAPAKGVALSQARLMGLAYMPPQTDPQLIGKYASPMERLGIKINEQIKLLQFVTREGLSH